MIREGSMKMTLAFAEHKAALEAVKSEIVTGNLNGKLMT